MQDHRHGWLPDSPDKRDFIYKPPRDVVRHLPKRVDLRPHCPPVYTQGSLDSCTANAIGGAIEFACALQGLARFRPSRLFIYYNERVIQHEERSDSGAGLRNAIKTVSKIGACHELEWPYDIGKFKQRPPATCYKAAPQHQVVRYERVDQNLFHLKAALASGFPFVFGLRLHQSFDTPYVAGTGRVPMPKRAGDPLVGCHAVMAVGYDDRSQRLIARNSWGPAWGLRGYFTMPYQYVLDRDYCRDFWMVSMVA